MQKDNLEPLAAIRDYYDQNTLRFRYYGAGLKTGAIHRPVWGKGVENYVQALHYVDRLILEEAINLSTSGQKSIHIADFGCGVGTSLIFLALNFGQALSGVGITISPVQVSLAYENALMSKLSDQLKFIFADFHSPPIGGEFDLIFAIESFAHTRHPEKFFRSISQFLRPGGRFVLCDDFLSSPDDLASLNSLQMHLLEAFRWGWRVPGVSLLEAVIDMARETDLNLMENRDLTSNLKLRPIPILLIKIFIYIFRLSGFRNPYFQSVMGGQALQLCLSQRLVEYRYLVFERSEIS